MYLAKTYLSGGGGSQNEAEWSTQDLPSIFRYDILSYELWFNVSYIFIQSVSPQGDLKKKMI